MEKQIHIQNLLNKKFVNIKSKNNLFTKRGFSILLGISASATNEILEGKRKISKKMAIKLANRLSLNPIEMNEFLKDFNGYTFDTSAYLNDSNNKQEFVKPLSQTEFGFIADPIHFSILSLINTSDFYSDEAWIARRLGVSQFKIKKALSVLKKLDLIYMNENNEIKRTHARISTTDDINCSSLKLAHLNDLQNIQKCINELDVKTRDFTALTLPLDPKLLNQAKEIIRNTQTQLLNLMSQSQHNNEVYKMCIYLFPITKNENNQ
jgi:uncharacterized protein (TIGR02147 family)